jgi:hypothetical protein
MILFITTAVKTSNPTYIKPVLQYGCEAPITATPAILKKLEVM